MTRTTISLMIVNLAVAAGFASFVLSSGESGGPAELRQAASTSPTQTPRSRQELPTRASTPSPVDGDLTAHFEVEAEWSGQGADARVDAAIAAFEQALAAEPPDLEAAASSLSVLRPELYPARRAEYERLEGRLDALDVSPAKGL